jgi:Domain of unknown function (DUF4271)
VTRVLYIFLLTLFFAVPSFAQTNSDSAIGKKDSSQEKKSLQNADTLNIRGDSLQSVKVDSAAGAIQKVDTPGSFLLSREILGVNPFFNFLGKRQTQLMQERNPPSKDYLFYLLLLLLLYFGLIKVLFEKYVYTLFVLFFRAPLRKQQIREQLLQAPLPSLLLNILFIVSSGLYASFLINLYHFDHHLEFPFLVLFCCTSIFIVYLVKFSLLKLCGWIFNISNATDAYIFIVFLVNKMTGILLLPFSIIIAFAADATINEFAAALSLIMIGILFIYRFINAFRHLRNEIKISLFHFFVYLCAFEITPVLLIYKVLLAYLEKAS